MTSKNMERIISQMALVDNLHKFFTKGNPMKSYTNCLAAVKHLVYLQETCTNTLLHYSSQVLQGRDKKGYGQELEQKFSDLSWPYDEELVETTLKLHGALGRSPANLQNRELIRLLQTNLDEALQRSFLNYFFTLQHQLFLNFLNRNFLLEDSQAPKGRTHKIGPYGLTINQFVIYMDKRGVLTALEEQGYSDYEIIQIWHATTGADKKILKQKMALLDPGKDVTAAYKRDLRIVDTIISAENKGQNPLKAIENMRSEFELA